MKTLILLLASVMLSAQSLTPQIGLHYTGGLSYDMRHEPFSAQLGIVYTPKVPDLIMSNIGISVNYYYDFVVQKAEYKNDFYILRLQFAKEFIEWYNITYYVGYVNSFDNNYMKSFRGDHRTNFSYGIGLQTTDPQLTAEILFESIAGYPHLSVGVNVNLGNLLKKKKSKILKQ